MSATYRNTGGPFDLENYVRPATTSRTVEVESSPGEVVRVDCFDQDGVLVAQEWYSLRRGVRTAAPIVAFVPGVDHAGR